MQNKQGHGLFCVMSYFQMATSCALQYFQKAISYSQKMISSNIILICGMSMHQENKRSSNMTQYCMYDISNMTWYRMYDIGNITRYRRYDVAAYYSISGGYDLANMTQYRIWSTIQMKQVDLATIEPYCDVWVCSQRESKRPLLISESV